LQVLAPVVGKLGSHQRFSIFSPATSIVSWMPFSRGGSVPPVIGILIVSSTFQPGVRSVL
jgi:hypothetical protein